MVLRTGDKRSEMELTFQERPALLKSQDKKAPILQREKNADASECWPPSKEEAGSDQKGVGSAQDL